MTKIGLMILLAHLKFCWHILNFAGTVFEVKVAPANNLRQQNFAVAAPENTDTDPAGNPPPSSPDTKNERKWLCHQDDRVHILDGGLYQDGMHQTTPA
jgi:hypothetical protein